MTLPTEIPNEILAIAVKVNEFLTNLPENKSSFYVSRVTFAFEGDDFTEFYLAPNDFEDYALKVNPQTDDTEESA